MVHCAAEASSGNKQMFFHERFLLPVEDDLITDVVFKFLPELRRQVCADLDCVLTTAELSVQSCVTRFQ